MTIERVREILNELAESKGITIKVPVTVNGRLTRTLGRVMVTVTRSTGYVEANSIEFSRQLLETTSEKSIISVIKHEFAHYYLAETTHENHGHGPLFKQVCHSIGCDNDGISTTVERIVAVNSKYDVFCSCCGEKVGEFSRACKTTQNPTLYSTKCCGATLIIQQNW